MKKLLLKLAVIAGLVTAVVYVTGAFFSDTETSADNVLASGVIDLKVVKPLKLDTVFSFKRYG